MVEAKGLRKGYGDRLLIDYFGMWSLPWDGYVEFMLPYGAWIRLFRAHGFAIDDLTPDDEDEFFRILEEA